MTATSGTAVAALACITAARPASSRQIGAERRGSTSASACRTRAGRGSAVTASAEGDGDFLARCNYDILMGHMSAASGSGITGGCTSATASSAAEQPNIDDTVFKVWRGVPVNGLAVIAARGEYLSIQLGISRDFRHFSDRIGKIIGHDAVCCTGSATNGIRNICKQTTKSRMIGHNQ